jgi:hypothetical protein
MLPRPTMRRENAEWDEDVKRALRGIQMIMDFFDKYIIVIEPEISDL